MSPITRRGFVGSLLGTAAATAIAAHQGQPGAMATRRPGSVAVKITDVKCAIIGRNPVIRIMTDAGISGYAQAESGKATVKQNVPYYKAILLGEDARDIGRIMLKIRRMGAMKPWGSAVSAIEIALWDVAGQATGLPVYELLGGKIRDRVCAYGNSENNSPVFSPRSPQECAEMAAKTKEAKEGFKLVKMPVGFHNSPMMSNVPNTWCGEHWTGRSFPYMDRGVMTKRGLDYVVSCVEAIRKVLGDDIDLA